MNESVLEHFGIKGMRWGVRRKRGKDGRVTGSPEHVQSRKLLRTKKLSQLSNDELSALNKRLQLEKKYNELNPTANAKGKRYMGQFLSKYGGVTAGALAGAAGTATAAKIILGSSKASAKAGPKVAKAVNVVRKVKG